MRAASASASGGRGSTFGVAATSSAGGSVLGAVAAAAQRRAAVTRALALSQRPTEPPATSGADPLPERYDRDAVQVTLDGLLGQLSERLSALEASRGG